MKSDPGTPETTPQPGRVPAAGVGPIVKDFVERALWTAGQVFVSVLLVVDPDTGSYRFDWKVALATAVGAAVVSVLTTALLYLEPLRRRVASSFLLDLLLRAVKTFISAFLGTIGAMQFDVLSFNWGHAAGIAVLTTLAALAKGALARGSADDNNPSTLASRTYASAYRP